MTTPDEQPWAPIDKDPNTIFLINPHGTRHLCFDQRTGTWWRLWQHRPAEHLGADGAALLRPSDIDQIIQLSIIWITRNPGHPGTGWLSDQLARNTKALGLHYASLAGAN